MAFATLAEYAISDGPEILLCYVNDVTSGLFMICFFMAVWLIMTFGNFFITKATTGSGDFPVSMTLGSFTTLIFSILMRLITCPYSKLTSDLALGVIIGLTLLSVIFLFTSRD